MAEIQPYRAFRYGDDLLNSVKSLVCPPYDIIPPEMQTALYKKNPLNFIRVEYTKGDKGAKYAEAARTWKEWVDRGILVRESSPAIYVYEAVFKSQADGRRLSRFGFFAALKAVPWGQGVYPHEKTLPTHKADRFSLFTSLRAQTSSIQVLFEDKGNRGMSLLKKAAKAATPWISFKDEAGVEHRLWRMTEGSAVKSLQGILKTAPVAIADGHHRYETALEYSRWAKSQEGIMSPASGYVMALFNPSGDPALEILPTHRAIPWEKRSSVKLERWGELIPVSGLNALRPLMLGKKGSSPTEVGVWWKDGFYRYRFASIPAALKGTPHAKLAVAVLHGGALDGLGKEDFFFTRKPEDAVAYAKKNNGWAIFLAPNTVKEVLAVCTAGKVMPPKSTYFYPKIPSGLLSHALAGGL
jgi:uncharacterized protein (DUF1015 family)